LRCPRQAYIATLLKRLFGMLLLAIALQMLMKGGHALWPNV
jgi:small neutral amino acid transporter SnatA (MarC family)